MLKLSENIHHSNVVFPCSVSAQVDFLWTAVFSLRTTGIQALEGPPGLYTTISAKQ